VVRSIAVGVVTVVTVILEYTVEVGYAVVEDTCVMVMVEVGVGMPRQQQAVEIALQAMFSRAAGHPGQTPAVLMLTGIEADWELLMEPDLPLVVARAWIPRLLTPEGMQVVIVVPLQDRQST